MFWGLFGWWRKHREEKKKELQRIQEEKRAAKDALLNKNWNEYVAAREAKARYAEHLEDVKVSSLDARREQMRGMLTARRAYDQDRNVQNSNVYQSDSDMVAAQTFIQSVTESISTTTDSSSSDCSSSDTGSSDSGSCGSSD